MWFRRLLSLALVGGVACAAAAQDKNNEVSKAVRALLDEQVAAWNAGKLDRFLATYWESDELVFYSGGTVSKGHRAVAARYRKNYQGPGKEMGRLTFSDLEVIPVADGAALARGRFRVVTKKDEVEGLFTLLVRKLPAGWKIVHDHTSKDDRPKKN